MAERVQGRHPEDEGGVGREGEEGGVKIQEDPRAGGGGQIARPQDEIRVQPSCNPGPQRSGREDSPSPAIGRVDSRQLAPFGCIEREEGEGGFQEEGEGGEAGVGDDQGAGGGERGKGGGLIAGLL